MTGWTKIYIFISGSLYAGAALMERTAKLIGDITISNIYAETLHFFKGFAFLVLAGIYFITVGLMAYVLFYNDKSTTTCSSLCFNVIDTNNVMSHQQK